MEAFIKYVTYDLQHSKRLHLRLTIDVIYEPNGVPEEDLRTMLGQLPNNAASDGMFTRNTPAEVSTWEYEITSPKPIKTTY
jgi:hypothetical protein